MYSCSKATWITDAMATQIPNDFPRIQAAVWFNFDQPTVPVDWRIESSSGATTAFRNAVALPRYVSHWP
jgi:hypothetical protein